MNPNARPETQAVHAGRSALRDLGVHAPPLDLSSTYPLPALSEATAALEALAGGAAYASNPVYARLHAPTVARFEEGLALLEGAAEAVAFSSGMAALTAALLAARERGTHVLAVRPLYGSADHLLESGLLGMRAEFVQESEVRASIRPDTALVIIETPANPTLCLVDIEAVVRQAGQVPVLVDSTFATPVLQQPLALGAAMVLHSATKFLGGHGDVVAGVIACSPAHGRSLRKVRAFTGALLHPLGAWLLHRGLPTLPLRVRAAQEGAARLAGRLCEHPAVARVLWPGLPGCDPRGLVRRQMKGPGSVLSFELKEGYAAAARALARVKLITPAVSLGSVDSLLQHPAGLTHRAVDAGVLEAHGVTPGLMRLSVGLEHPDDLWEDLLQAFRQG